MQACWPTVGGGGGGGRPEGCEGGSRAVWVGRRTVGRGEAERTLGVKGGVVLGKGACVRRGKGGGEDWGGFDHHAMRDTNNNNNATQRQSGTQYQYATLRRGALFSLLQKCPGYRPSTSRARSLSLLTSPDTDTDTDTDDNDNAFSGSDVVDLLNVLTGHVGREVGRERRDGEVGRKIRGRWEEGVREEFERRANGVRRRRRRGGGRGRGERP